MGSKYQIDDKNDRFEDDEFISYSADRVSLFTSRYWRYQQWDFTLSGQYRLSEYHDKNTYGGESDTLREDDRLSLFANLTYHVNDNLSLHTEIDISNNSSTHEENEYDQNTLSLGATWQFN